MHRAIRLAACLTAVTAAACSSKKDQPPPAPAPSPSPAPAATTPPTPKDSAERARELARAHIIADGHIDVPYRLQESRAPDGSFTEDISQRTPQGEFDYVRAREGGLDAPFMSIYIPADKQKQPGASRKLADELIDMVEGFAKAHPDKFALARSPADVEANFRAGKISLPMGIENGAALEDDLANVEHFHRRGVRYITLTHSKDNQICDSSYDDARTWKGLSPFGRKVVAEMNRVGIMVDVSHISDDAFWQVIEVSKAPVIASHSSLRHFTPGFERNLTDDQVKAIAERGGVVLINFGSSFISDESRKYFDAKRKAVTAFADKQKLDREDPKVKEFAARYDADHGGAVYATVQDVADHIDRAVKIAGIDHVGFGSDFDGVGDSLPTGLKDVSMYPNLIRELLDRGYSDADIAKLCGANFLRVWRRVEEVAAATARAE